MTKLAFTTLACPDWSLPQVIDAARRYGYDGVELRLLDGEVIELTLPRGERERVRRQFDEAGLRSSASTPLSAWPRRRTPPRWRRLCGASSSWPTSGAHRCSASSPDPGRPT